MDKNWIEVSIKTTSEAVEAVSGILYNTGVQGVSVEDPDDVEFKKKHPRDWDYFDNSLLKSKDYALVKAYFEEDENFNDTLAYIKNSVDKLSEFDIDAGLGIVKAERVNEEDWANNWKKYYKPTRVGSKVVVVPIWEEYEKKDEDVVVRLDPGMAFGTGTHETTRMCIKQLEKYVGANTRIFDIGTGSGILSIVSAKLGAAHATGVDMDPVAVRSACENIKYNDVQNIDIIEGNLMDVIKGKADIVVANIIADIIIPLTDEVKNFLERGGIFISSGILRDRKDEVVSKLQNSGFEIESVNEDGEWVCVSARLVEE